MHSVKTEVLVYRSFNRSLTNLNKILDMTKAHFDSFVFFFFFFLISGFQLGKNKKVKISRSFT